MARLPSGYELLEVGPEAVQRYLMEAAQPEWDVLSGHPDFTPRWAVAFLKRARHISREAYGDIFHHKLLRKHYPVRLELLRCRFAPPSLSVNLIPTLRWVDLYNSLRSPVLTGAARQRIEQRLMEIMPRLTLGEKLMMARQAPKPLVRHLRLVDDPRVIRVLLGAYHFTYEDASFLANYPEITSPVLEELALSKKWRRFKEIRLALVRNERVPHSVIYPLVKTLNKRDLEALIADKRLSLFARRIIERVLEEGMYLNENDY